MIELEREKETMLIPLYGKAMDNKNEHSILHDKKAEEIIDGISYDFSRLKIQSKTNIMMCLRAKLIDDLTVGYIEDKSKVLILHLGCGLDSRCERVKVKTADWYDLDFPEVIEIRKMFYKDSKEYHMISSSVTEEAWIRDISKTPGKRIVIAEGLFMYLKEEEIKTLLKRLKEQIGEYTIIFDSYSRLTAKYAGNHPSLKQTGAVINWGLDNPLDIEKWMDGLSFVEEYYFTEIDDVKNLGIGTRMMYRFMGLFSAARRAHRVLVYNVD